MRKSQIKIMESMAVLFVFFILLGFGLIFYSKLQRGSIQETQSEFVTLSAIETAQLVSFLPELSCTQNNVRIENCFDKLKLESFRNYWNETTESLAYYNSLFGNTLITIEEIYPDSNFFVVYNNSLSGNVTMLSTQVPILLFNATAPKNKDFTFGVLEVNVYTTPIGFSG